MEQEEEEGSSDGEPEIWSGWHSWPDKEDKTEKDRQKDVSKGLEELEELMDVDYYTQMSRRVWNLFKDDSFLIFFYLIRNSRVVLTEERSFVRKY